jgi:hypothetical protein
MTPDRYVIRHRAVTETLDNGPVRLPSHKQEVIVTGTLLALLVAAIAANAGTTVEIGDAEMVRQSPVAFVIEVIATLGFSIGLAWLLFQGCRHDDGGPRP